MKKFLLLISILSFFLLNNSWKGLVFAESISLVLQDKNKELSLKHKLAGDDWFKKGELKKAAKEYLEALKLSKDYDLEEIITMGIRIAWGGKLKEAEEIFREVLQKDPQNRRAILYLVRVISWQGRQIEALNILDDFLRKYPSDEEALLLKANALRYLGRSDLALKFYDEILSKREDFDTRLGKAYAYANLGIPSKVEENFKLLKPIYPYQEKDLKELEKFKNFLFNPSFLAGFTYFQDTDNNEVYTYRLGFEGYVKDFRILTNYYYREGSDDYRKAYSNEFIVDVGKRITDFIWLSANLGISQGGFDKSFVIGGINLSKLFLKGQMGFSLNKRVLVDTAELIERNIRVLTANFFLNQVITDCLSIYVNYNHRWYSDSNQADFVRFSFPYKIKFGNPSLSIGYRIVYWDFKKQTRHGYFDPNDFWANQIFFTIYYEKSWGYLYLEPFVGYQIFKRYGDWSYDKVYAGTGIIGLKLKDKLNLEMSLEGGNYAAGAVTGWKYYQSGFLLKYVF